MWGDVVDEFNIYTREAGAGQLSVAVEGPSKAKMEVVDRGNGYTTVGYVVSKPGRTVYSTIHYYHCSWGMYIEMSNHCIVLCFIVCGQVCFTVRGLHTRTLEKSVTHLISRMFKLVVLAYSLITF